MTTFIIFLAGISLGLASDKLYHLVVNKKHTEEKEPVQTEEVLSEAEEGHDDLSQLKGVGPKLADALDKIGIYNYAQLSSSSVDTLLEQLGETGGKFSRSVISSVVERAQLAANENSVS